MSELREKRQAAGLTMAKLSRLSGVNRATLCWAETRGLVLKPLEQQAIDKVLADYARMRMRILEQMTAEKMVAE